MRPESKERKLRAVDGRSSIAEGVAGGIIDSNNGEPQVERCVAGSHCFGTGMRVTSGGARRCDCQDENYAARLLEMARIPLRYAKCSMDTFEPLNGTQEAAFSFARQLALDYPAVDRGLLLVGPVGVGKTHLAVAIIRDLIRGKNTPCLFYQFAGLLKEIQNSYNPISQTSELGVLQPVFDADVLVLDELGGSKPTEWVRDTLMHIINTRYNDKRLTIFTTNYRDQVKTEARLFELKGKLRHLQERLRTNETNPEIEAIEEEIQSAQKETLEERIGTPLRSRLYEMCKTVAIEGEDYRKGLDKRRSNAV